MYRWDKRLFNRFCNKVGHLRVVINVITNKTTVLAQSCGITLDFQRLNINTRRYTARYTARYCQLSIDFTDQCLSVTLYSHLRPELVLRWSFKSPITQKCPKDWCEFQEVEVVWPTSRDNYYNSLLQMHRFATWHCAKRYSRRLEHCIT